MACKTHGIIPPEAIAALSRAPEAVAVFETTPGNDESWVKDRFLATPPAPQPIETHVGYDERGNFVYARPKSGSDQ